MRRALILSAIPTGAMAALLYLRPEYLPNAPTILAMIAAGCLGLAFLAHMAKEGWN